MLLTSAVGPDDVTAAKSIRQCGKRWFELAPSGKLPGERCSHTATRVGWNIFIIGGGRVTGKGARDYLWEHYASVPVLNVRSMSWSVHLSSDTPFPARRGHSAVLHKCGKQIIVFGGTCEGTGHAGQLNDTWALQNVDTPEQLSWTSPQVTGTVPARRRGHRAVVSGDHMVVIGGYGQGMLFVLDLVKWTWSSLQITAAPDGTNPPLQLALFGCALLGGCLILFGGQETRVTSYPQPHLTDAMSNELHLIDLSSVFTGHKPGPVAWQRLEGLLGSPPSARHCCEFADAGLGHLILFGGTTSDGVALNDTHLLVLSAPDDPLRSKADWCPVELLSGSSVPKERNAMSMTAFDSRFIVFGGGIFAKRYYSDTWCFELEREVRPRLLCTPYP